MAGQHAQSPVPIRNDVPMTPALQPTPTGFLRHGTPHQIVSGALHYFRVHPDLWRDRLRRLKALGCDTVETYVAWNLHAPTPDTVTFEGQADLGAFLDLAAEEGLDIIARPGPYICAEWEGGGFPGWILQDTSMRLRRMDDAYLDVVDRWFDQLIPIIASRQASRGGRVVMVQVENEYGSFGDDSEYLAHLRDGLIARGIDELLVTSDGPSRQWLQGGTIDGALATVNFGSRTEDVLELAARELPDQPLMCMEFWNGWFDHWGEEHHTRSAASAAAELETMLSAGMSVNFYMAHGGTNIGLLAGANNTDGVLEPTTTSYDYDAPIGEDGTLTDKFHAFREVIGRHRELPPVEDHLAALGLDAAPSAEPAGDVEILSRTRLRDTARWTGRAPVHTTPPAFEEVGLERGLLLYRRDLELERIDDLDDGPTIAPLQLFDLHDRAWVFVDGHPVGPVASTGNSAVGARAELGHLVEVLLPEGQDHRTVTVEILVENQGRTNFGPMLGERKGILGGVWHRVRWYENWEAVPWALEELADDLTASVAGLEPVVGIAEGGDLPLLITGRFEATGERGAHLDVSGAGHGVAWVNGTCVGRYWCIGPQQALYIPAPLLHGGTNDVLLLELEQPEVSLSLASGPLWGAQER